MKMIYLVLLSTQCRKNLIIPSNIIVKTYENDL